MGQQPGTGRGPASWQLTRLGSLKWVTYFMLNILHFIPLMRVEYAGEGGLYGAKKTLLTVNCTVGNWKFAQDNKNCLLRNESKAVASKWAWLWLTEEFQSSRSIPIQYITLYSANCCKVLSFSLGTKIDNNFCKNTICLSTLNPLQCATLPGVCAHWMARKTQLQLNLHIFQHSHTRTLGKTNKKCCT